MAVVFVAHLVWHIIDRNSGWYYFIYLTHWSFILETVYMVVLLWADCTGQSQLPVRSWDSNASMPLAASMALFLFSIVQPLSFAVVVLYWTLDNPFWAMTYTPDYLGYFTHGIDWILMLISFFFGRVPYTIWNSGWLLVLGLIFLVWTYIHYRLQIGTLDPCNEGQTPAQQCPIYSVLDWNYPETALAVAAGVIFVGLPVFILVYLALNALRNCFDQKSDLKAMDDEAESQERLLRQQELELGRGKAFNVDDQDICATLCCRPK